MPRVATNNTRMRIPLADLGAAQPDPTGCAGREGGSAPLPIRTPLMYIRNTLCLCAYHSAVADNWDIKIALMATATAEARQTSFPVALPMVWLLFVPSPSVLPAPSNGLKRPATAPRVGTPPC